jgi:hypothetical protein
MDLIQINSSLLGGAFYLFTLLDDHSKKLWVYFLKRKSNVFGQFKEWQALVQHQTALKLKALCSDHGGEYTLHEFQAYLRSEGISSQFSVPYTPQQNGAAERLNCSIQDAVRMLLVQSGLPSRSGLKRSPTLSIQRITCLTVPLMMCQSVCGLAMLPLLRIFVLLAAGHGNTLQSLTSVL